MDSLEHVPPARWDARAWPQCPSRCATLLSPLVATLNVIRIHLSSHRLRAFVRAASGRLPRVRPADSARVDQRLPRVPGCRIAVAACPHVRARGISSRWAAWARAASCSSTVVRYAPPAVGDVSRALVAAGSGEVFPERLRQAGVYRPVAAWYLATMRQARGRGP